MPNKIMIFRKPEAIIENTSIVSRFLDYVKYPTQANEKCDSCPTSPGQLELAKHIVAELHDMGLTNALMDNNGYVYAKLENNCGGRRIGLIAHMDTATDFPGKGVASRLHKDYAGGVIRLEHNVSIDPSECPELTDCIGDNIITSDGTTLLGADDKAGIAEIMAALEILVKNPDIRRPHISICFTPDEEIGRGPDKFDLNEFGADLAYTVDGGFIGEINSENFNADKAVVELRGVSVHPGRAYGKMVNAIDLATGFLNMLPRRENPRSTRDREGFFHPIEISGDAACVTITMILRDFGIDSLLRRRYVIESILEGMKQRQPHIEYKLDIEEQYRNTAELLAGKPEITDSAKEAVELAGIAPLMCPLRGGTDGAELTVKGLPTVNLFIGGVNYHGPQEWISTRAMALSVCTILNLVQLWTE